MGLFLVLQGQSELLFALRNNRQQVMAAPESDRDAVKAPTRVIKEEDRRTYQCAHVRDVEPWCFAARVKAFCRNFKENSCSISPNSTRPSIVL